MPDYESFDDEIEMSKIELIIFKALENVKKLKPSYPVVCFPENEFREGYLTLAM